MRIFQVPRAVDLTAFDHTDKLLQFFQISLVQLWMNILKCVQHFERIIFAFNAIDLIYEELFVVIVHDKISREHSWPWLPQVKLDPM